MQQNQEQAKKAQIEKAKQSVNQNRRNARKRDEICLGTRSPQKTSFKK